MIATIQKPGFGNGWAPAPYSPRPTPYSPVRQEKEKGKAMGALTVSGIEKFFADPTLAFVTSIVAAGASAYLGYGLNVVREKSLALVADGKIRPEQVPGSTWPTFWWIMATAMGVKALHDLSRIP